MLRRTRQIQASKFNRIPSAWDDNYSKIDQKESIDKSSSHLHTEIGYISDQ